MDQGILTTLEEQVKPEHTALLVIDPQNDFCSPHGALPKLMGWDVSRMQEAAQRLDKFISRARDRGVMIVWTRSIIDTVMSRPSFRARKFVTEAVSRSIELVKWDTSGSEWYSGMTRPLENEHVITKHHYDAFSDTSLDLLLTGRRIKTILLTGFTTNVCVETTARHGYIKGYYVVVLSDCTDAPTQQEYDATLLNIRTYFGRVATSDKIIGLWSKM
ncbi:MAG: cysteine hydrolase [Deltaproteobacteria bacterium]|nr:cysteine hydrolase [Deltaproteobacteria bacterium]